MALRLQLFREGAEVAWVSASDADEDSLVELLAAIAQHATVDLEVQGEGELPADEVPGVVQAVDAFPVRTDEQRVWAAVLRRALAAPGPLTWSTTFDQGGSVASAEEFHTDWSGSLRP